MNPDILRTEIINETKDKSVVVNSAPATREVSSRRRFTLGEKVALALAIVGFVGSMACGEIESGGDASCTSDFSKSAAGIKDENDNCIEDGLEFEEALKQCLWEERNGYDRNCREEIRREDFKY